MSAVCPECGQGKHRNCTGEALDDNDQLVECRCLDVACVPVAEQDLHWCAAQTYAGTHLQPPEFCENEAVPGSEFCSGHCEPDDDGRDQ